MTPAHKNPNRRRGMHPMRDFDTLAADLARFDFSTRAGANVFYCHAAEKWTTGEIIDMHRKKPRIVGYDPAEPSERRECVCLSRADGIAALARYGMTETEAGKAIVKTWKTHDAVLRFWVTRINPVALAVKTLDELYQEAQCEIAAAKYRGYLGAKRTHGGTMAEGVERLLEKTIRELQNAKAKPRNQHPRKKRGADGQAVTKTEAANVLGITRPTLDKYLRNPTPPFGDPISGKNYLAAVMSNQENFDTFTSQPHIVAWIKHRNKAIDGETVHPERIDDIADPDQQHLPAKPSNIHRNRADKTRQHTTA